MEQELTGQKSKKDELSKRIKTYPNQKARLPRVWIGYLLSVLLFFFAAGAIPVIDSLARTGKFPPAQAVPIAIPVFAAFVVLYVASLLYWFFCVYRIHVILRNLRSSYPITPWRAVLCHFIPIFGFYWVFKWPKEVVLFVNSQWATLTQDIGEDAVAQRGRRKYTLGIVLLLTYFLDTAFTSILPWQEGAVVSILFLFIVYLPLLSIVSGVREAIVIQEWKPSGGLQPPDAAADFRPKTKPLKTNPLTTGLSICLAIVALFCLAGSITSAVLGNWGKTGGPVLPLEMVLAVGVASMVGACFLWWRRKWLVSGITSLVLGAHQVVFYLLYPSFRWFVINGILFIIVGLLLTTVLGRHNTKLNDQK